jgi:dTDP-glucose 4,6-dehydratase
MQNILVTGGAGFIGANFVRYLLAVEPRVNLVNLDALTYAGCRENLADLPDPARHEFVEGDICDRASVDELLETHRVDTVVHFAAESHVDRSILGPEQFVRTNVMGTFTLLEACRRYWSASRPEEGPRRPNRFHHISTDEVFGSLGKDEPSWTEDAPYAPNSPYAASKAAADHLVRAYGHTYGLPCTITNCSNNYGPYQFPEKLIPLVILNAVRGRPLPVYGDGGQIRDWLHVEDHCEAIRLVLLSGQVGRTYNVGGSVQPTNLEVVRSICRILDELRPDAPQVPHSSLISFVADRPGHDRRYAIDSARLHDELGWRPRHSLETGLRETVKWYLTHPDWCAKVQARGDYQSWIERNYGQR